MATNDAINELGFGFPSFKSQAQGTEQNRGPWIALTPRVRALQTLPPKAKAQLRGLAALRGRMHGTLGQEDYEILTGNYDVYEFDGGGYATMPDYGTSLPPVTYEGSSTQSWGTDEAAAGAAKASSAGMSFPTFAEITNLLKAGMQLQAQQKIIDLNVERARAGLSPLDPRYFSPSAAVNFGLTPQTTQMLLYGALAIGAVMLIGRRSKK